LYTLLNERINYLARINQLHLLCNGFKGIEKESLRVSSNGHIAMTPHPTALGSALTHPYITTDFSEALLELVTPPFANVEDVIDFQQIIHQYIYQHIEDELLWANSMPCHIRPEQDIPIAQYGSSNSGHLKHVYRLGLAKRYGRAMQAISGIHFNYSVPLDFWPIFQSQCGDKGPLSDFISENYMGLARNVLRYDWLVLYLFGNSPGFANSFVTALFNGSPIHVNELEQQEWDLSNSTHTEPYATSLRMSNMGYKSGLMGKLGVSYNSLADYTKTLRHATEEPHAPYQALGVVMDGQYTQLNGNGLQIENEFYTSIRPKQAGKSGERPLRVLAEQGVCYMELRSIDVNTFEPLGVNAPELRFLEAFMLFCLLQESPTLEERDTREFDQNVTSVVHRGRDPELKLYDNGRPRRLQDWAAEILTQFDGICQTLDSTQNDCTGPRGTYTKALALQKAKVADSELTPSARVLREMSANKESFTEFSMRKSQEHRQAILAHSPDSAKMDEFSQIAKKSLQKQKDMEYSDQYSFEEYLRKYLEQ